MSNFYNENHLKYPKYISILKTGSNESSTVRWVPRWLGWMPRWSRKGRIQGPWNLFNVDPLSTRIYLKNSELLIHKGNYNIKGRDWSRDTPSISTYQMLWWRKWVAWAQNDLTLTIVFSMVKRISLSKLGFTPYSYSRLAWKIFYQKTLSFMIESPKSQILSSLIKGVL